MSFVVTAVTSFLIIILFPIGNASAEGLLHSELEKVKSATAAFTPSPEISFSFLGEKRRIVGIEDVVKNVLDRSLRIQDSKLRVREAEGARKVAAAYFLPSLSPSTYLQRRDGRIQGSFGKFQEVGFSTAQAGIFVRYGLNPFESAFRLIGAGHNLEAAKSNSLAMIQISMAETTRLFIDLQYAATSLAIANEMVKNAEDLGRISKVREARGIGLGEDVHRSAVNLFRSQRRVIESQQDYINSMLALTEALNLDTSVALIPRQSTVQPYGIIAETMTLEEMLAAAEHSRPELQSAQQKADAAAAELKRQRWEYLAPRFDVEYQLGGINDHYRNLGKQEGVAFLVSWNFSPVLWGSRKEKLARSERSVVNVQRVLLELRRRIQQSYQEFLTSKKLIGLSLSEVESAEATLRISRSRFDSGTGLAIEVIQAQNELAEARLNFFGSIAAYNKTQIQLLHEIGEINPSVFTSL